MDIKPILASNEIFCNSKGSLRRSLVRKHYGLYKEESLNAFIQTKPLCDREIKEITGIYKTWRDTVEIMPVRNTYVVPKYIDLKNTASSPEKWINSFNMNTGKIAVKFNEKSDIVCYEGEESEWFYSKCSKRGNDVYIKSIRKKFKPLIDESKKVKTFFSTRENKNRKRVKTTRLLFITGTYKQDVSLDYAWMHCGKHYNSFITNIRQKFKGVEFIKAFQAQKNGYPHFHALVIFPNFDFTVVPKLEYSEKKKQNTTVWRIHNRQQVNGKPCINQIVNCWPHGMIDVKAVDSYKKGLTEIIKYITRDLEGGESDLTNAMAWYFGKQSYSISKNFVKEITGRTEKELCIDLAEPNNANLINASGVIQRSNSKKKLIKIEIFPAIKYDLVPKISQKKLWYDDKNENPPPEQINFFEKMADSCKPSKMSVREDGVQIIVYEYKENKWS